MTRSNSPRHNDTETHRGRRIWDKIAPKYDKPHAKDIQEWCGHSSYQVTMDTYGHLFPERQGELAAALDVLRRSQVHRSDVVSIR